MEWLLIALLSTNDLYTTISIQTRFESKQECMYVGNHLAKSKLVNKADAKCFEVKKRMIRRTVKRIK